MLNNYCTVLLFFLIKSGYLFQVQEESVVGVFELPPALQRAWRMTSPSGSQGTRPTPGHPGPPAPTPTGPARAPAPPCNSPWTLSSMPRKVVRLHFSSKLDLTLFLKLYIGHVYCFYWFRLWFSIDLLHALCNIETPQPFPLVFQMHRLCCPFLFFVFQWKCGLAENSGDSFPCILCCCFCIPKLQFYASWYCPHELPCMWKCFSWFIRFFYSYEFMCLLLEIKFFCFYSKLYFYSFILLAGEGKFNSSEFWYPFERVLSKNFSRFSHVLQSQFQLIAANKSFSVVFLHSWRTAWAASVILEWSCRAAATMWGLTSSYWAKSRSISLFVIRLLSLFMWPSVNGTSGNQTRHTNSVHACIHTTTVETHLVHSRCFRGWTVCLVCCIVYSGDDSSKSKRATPHNPTTLYVLLSKVFAKLLELVMWLFQGFCRSFAVV